MLSLKVFSRFGKNTPLLENFRKISLTATNNLKEIKETKVGNTITVEGVIYPDPKEHLYLKPTENGACCLCSSGIDLKHTDVLILRQFTKDDGRVLPRRITGLCKTQQKRVSIMIAMSQKAGLLVNTLPGKNKEPINRPKWKKYNTYYEEGTIMYRYW